MNERGTLISILAIGGALFTYLGIQTRVNQPSVGNTTWMLAIGLFMFAYGLILHQSEKAYERFENSINTPAGWLGVFRWQIILLGLSPGFIILGSLNAGFLPKMHNLPMSIGTWIMGILLVLAGGYKWGENKPKFSKKVVLFSVLLTYIAFLLRGIGTEALPNILTGDEGSAGLSAVRFINGEWNNIFISGWFSFPSFFSFIQSLSIRLFGQTTEALRLVSAVVGALTVTATYIFGKAMFGQRAGILAGIALAALHFHIHFSRLGINNVWDGLGYTLTLGALWYAWTYNKRFAYLFAGLAMGFAQYFYATSRGLLGIVILCSALAFFVQRSQFKRALPDLILMLAIAVAVTFPLMMYYIQEPNQFIAPFIRVSPLHNNATEAIGNIVSQLLVGFQAFTYAPLRYWYRPETPILRPIFATFFYLGVIFLLLKNRDSRLVILAMWLLLFGFIGGLSDSPPASQRYVAAAPVCALVVGYGVHKIIDFFEKLWPKYSKLVTGLGYAIMTVAVISDLGFYFIEYRGMELIYNLDSPGAIAQKLATDLQDKSAGTQVVFLHHPLMGYYSIGSLQYLAPHVKGIDAPEEWGTFDQKQLNGNTIIFISLADNFDKMEPVQKDFPGGTLTSKKAWNGEILFWLYEYRAN